jgi:GxxExxY protein
MAELIFKEEAFRVVGICMKIHKTLGMGLKEINYKDAIEIEFIEDALPYYREKKYSVNTRIIYCVILTYQILLCLIP